MNHWIVWKNYLQIIGENMKLITTPTNLIFFIFLLALCSFSLISNINAETVIVASEQDATLAYQLSNHLNSSVVIIPWGSTDKKYVDKIQHLNPEEIIIIGGKYSVPECFNIGNYKRFAGKDRVETAYLVLSQFYNINYSGNLIYYPSKDEILKVIDEKRNWTVFEGNSPISKKWSKFIYYSLKKDDPHGNKTVIYVGNINNNPQMKDSWDIELPYIISFCPAVIYHNNALYITGSDENLPSTIGRLLAKHIIYKVNDLFLFAVILLITFAVFYYYTRSPYCIIALVISILWVFWHRYDFGIVWDALFVYLDGALSLLYLGHYETIISGRSFCGLSYFLCIWFKIFKPSLESIAFYQIYVFFILIGTMVIYFRRKILALLALLILITSPLFTKYVLMFSTELTFITFLILILCLLKKFDNKLNGYEYRSKNKYNYINKYINNYINIYVNKYILILSSITAIASLVRIHALIVPLIYLVFKRNKLSTCYLMFSMVMYGLLLTITSGHVLGYVEEVSTKGGITLNLIISNILYYLPKFVKLLIVPLIIMAYELWKKMKFNKFNISLAVVFFIMPLLWVSQDERYLLPSIVLFIITCLEPLEYLDIRKLFNKK